MHVYLSKIAHARGRFFLDRGLHAVVDILLSSLLNQNE